MGHLTPLIELSPRAAATPWARAEIVRKLLSVLSGPDAMVGVLLQREPSRIEQLAAVASANAA